MRSSRDWLLSSLIGGFAGLVVGAVVAVNFIIVVGIGYDVSPVEIFRERPLVGMIAAVIQIGAPILGAVFVHRLRNPKESRRPADRP